MSRKEINAYQTIKRCKQAIEKRFERGETPETSKKLAQMIDRLYNTNLTGKYHN